MSKELTGIDEKTRKRLMKTEKRFRRDGGTYLREDINKYITILEEIFKKWDNGEEEDLFDKLNTVKLPSVVIDLIMEESEDMKMNVLREIDNLYAVLRLLDFLKIAEFGYLPNEVVEDLSNNIAKLLEPKSKYEPCNIKGIDIP